MFPIQLRKRYTAGLIEGIQEWFKRERSVEYPSMAIESALETWLENHYDGLMESLPELLISPERTESQEFQRILEGSVGASVATAVGVIVDETLNPVFTGARSFSKEKLGAMIAHIAAKGHDVYRTNLNKLLFYSDMTAYYLRGQGISGASYLNMPYGPVPENVDAVTNELAESGLVTKVDVPEFGPAAQRIIANADQKDSTDLSAEEMETIDWVLATYGEMSSSEISEYSHLEKAYKFTRPREPIAYEYAKFFKKLPAKDS